MGCFHGLSWLLLVASQRFSICEKGIWNLPVQLTLCIYVVNSKCTNSNVAFLINDTFSFAERTVLLWCALLCHNTHHSLALWFHVCLSHSWPKKCALFPTFLNSKKKGLCYNRCKQSVALGRVISHQRPSVRTFSPQLSDSRCGKCFASVIDDRTKSKEDRQTAAGRSSKESLSFFVI